MLPVADLDEKPSTDWSWLLLELRPAIDKCLSHTSGSAPHVLRAWAMDLGRVGMYTSNDEAQLFHCTAPAFGSEIDDIKRLPQRAPGPTRLRPLFRPPGRTPGRLCGERVLDDEGDLVGFLVYGACQNRRR